MEKNNKGLIMTIIIFGIVILGLSGYLVYDKLFVEKDGTKSNTTTDNTSTNNCVDNNVATIKKDNDIFYLNDFSFEIQNYELDRKNTTAKIYVGLDYLTFNALYNNEMDGDTPYYKDYSTKITITEKKKVTLSFNHSVDRIAKFYNYLTKEDYIIIYENTDINGGGEAYNIYLYNSKFEEIIKFENVYSDLLIGFSYNPENNATYRLENIFEDMYVGFYTMNGCNLVKHIAKLDNGKLIDEKKIESVFKYWGQSC